jgi:hypothetical protein
MAKTYQELQKKGDIKVKNAQCKKAVTKLLNVLVSITVLQVCFYLDFFTFSDPVSAYGTSFANATTANWGTKYSGTASPEHYYKVQLTAGDELHISLYNVAVNNDVDLYVYNPSQSQVASAGYGGNSNEYISYTAPTTGQYYIKVHRFITSTNGQYSFYAIKAGYTGGQTNSTYSRTNAKNYAINWASYPGNPSYDGQMFAAAGGDCTNFASQVLGANMNVQTQPSGGLAQNNPDWYYTNQSARSYSWSRVTNFISYWGTGTNGVGTKRAYAMKVYTVEEALETAKWSEIYQFFYPGDIIQLMGEDGVGYHIMVIDYMTSQTNPPTITYAQHSGTKDTDNTWTFGKSLRTALTNMKNDGQGHEFIYFLRISY